MSDPLCSNSEPPDEEREPQTALSQEPQHNLEENDDGQPTTDQPDSEVQVQTTPTTFSISVAETEEPSVGREIEISSFTNIDISNFSKRPNPGFARSGIAPQRAQFTVKPSLLRRSRGPGNNPLLKSQLPTASSTRPDSEATPVPVVESSSAVVVDSVDEPEIFIWQPDPTDTCEIIEVQESDLASFLQQKTEGEGEIQQIIVCGDGGTEGVDFAEMFQNYMVEVLPEETVVSVKKKSKKKPRPLKVAGDGHAPRMSKNGKNISELKCQEPDCDHYSNNVQEMRKHLHEVHEVMIDEEMIHFASEEDFKRWRSAYERDRRISFIYRGGTKKITPERAVTYLICHRSGTYKPAMADTTQRLRKLKPQGSCKIGGYCTAGIKLIKQLNTGIVEATICHTHYGHELDNVQHLRISQAMKTILVQKFNEGLSFAQVLQYVHHNPGGLEGFKLIDRRAIRNIYDQWRKPTKTDQTLNESGCSDSQPSEARTYDGETGEEITGDGEPHGQPIIVKLSDEEQKTRTTLEPIVEPSTPAKKKFKRSKGKGGAKVKVENIETATGTDVDHEESEEVESKSSSSDTSFNVEATMEKLLEHGDSGAGPTVLLYKKPEELEPHTGLATPLLKKEDLCVVLQTPIQRQLLQQFGKVVHLELVVGQDMDILVMVVLDDYLMAIPVAWLVCNQVTENMIKNFFQVILTNCIEISCDYLFASKKSDLHRLWCNVFDKEPRLLYPQDDVLRELKSLLRKYFEAAEMRGKCFEILETLVTTPDKTKFDSCCKELKTMARSPDFEKSFIQNWYSERNRWAFHTRTEVHGKMEESFVRLRKFILFKGTKLLGKNIEGILKIGYDKCFQHNKQMFKGDAKVKTLVSEIDSKHEMYSKYDWSVERVGPNKFKMSLENIFNPDLAEEFDIFDLKTVCTCRMRCEECGVCIHQFWCTCGDQNLCIHSHALRVYLAIQTEPAEAEITETNVVRGYGEEEDPFLEFGHQPVREQDTKSDIVTNTDEEKEAKPAVNLSARKMKNSSKKVTVKKGKNRDPEEREIPAPILIQSPETPSGSRRSIRMKKAKIIDQDPLALSTPNPVPVTRKRPGAPVLLDVVPIPIRKSKKSSPEVQPEEQLDLKPVLRGRGRPRVEDNVNVRAQSLTKSVPASTPKRTRNSTPAVPLTSFRRRRGEPEDSDTASVKNELLALMNQIERIKSARVLKDVKKRISNLSGIVNKQRRTQ